jgi:hypothetical protein
MSKRKYFEIETDDFMSMQSTLRVEVVKDLSIVEFNHIKQNGVTEGFRVFPSDLEKLAKQLLAYNDWIKSGYKEKAKPEKH